MQGCQLLRQPLSYSFLFWDNINSREIVAALWHPAYTAQGSNFVDIEGLGVRGVVLTKRVRAQWNEQIKVFPKWKRERRGEEKKEWKGAKSELTGARIAFVIYRYHNVAYETIALIQNDVIRFLLVIWQTLCAHLTSWATQSCLIISWMANVLYTKPEVTIMGSHKYETGVMKRNEYSHLGQKYSYSISI